MCGVSRNVVSTKQQAHKTKHERPWCFTWSFLSFFLPFFLSPMSLFAQCTAPTERQEERHVQYAHRCGSNTRCVTLRIAPCRPLGHSFLSASLVPLSRCCFQSALRNPLFTRALRALPGSLLDTFRNNNLASLRSYSGSTMEKIWLVMWLDWRDGLGFHRRATPFGRSSKDVQRMATGQAAHLYP